MLPAAGVPLLKFGPFKVDVRSGELHKNGTRLRLQEKPLRVLELLAKHQGQLVTREELKKHLWPDDDFVDFETGLNTAVKKLRGALADNAENPRYIETIPRRGYRFLVPVEIVSSVEKPLTASAGPPISSADSGSESAQPSLVQSEPPAGTVNPTAGESARRSNRKPWIWAVAGAVALGLAVASVWLARSRPLLSFQLRDSVLIADFENQTSDPRLGRALQTAFTVSVDQSRYANVFARTRVGSVLRRMGRADTEIITPSIGIEICQREGIRGLLLPEISQAGQEYMLTVQLIDPTTGSSVRSYSQRPIDENHLLNALDKISEDVRQDLGESLYQIHRADRPLAQVTTPSLEALKDYTEGQRLWHSSKYDQAVARYQAALAADPDFVMANASLGDA